MKNRVTVQALCTLLIMVIFLSGCSTGYKIEGNISGDTEGKTIYLYKGREAIDSTILANGKFRFEGKLPVASFLTVRVISNQDKNNFSGNAPVKYHVIPLFLDKGKVVIHADLDEIPNSYHEGYDYSKISVTGPKVNGYFMDYLDEKRQEFENMHSLKSGYYIHNPNSMSEGIAEVEKAEAGEAAYRKFVKEQLARNSANPLAPYILSDNMNIRGIGIEFSAAEIDQLIALLPPQQKQTETGKVAVENAEKVRSSSVGAPYIDYVFVDVDGNNVRVSDYACKGKYVMLEFWASWCAPCRWEIPHLKKVYESYNPVGFEIISISLDTDHKEWVSAMEKEEMSWLQLSYPEGFDGQLRSDYNFAGIPMSVLIDPEGNIVDRSMRGSRMDKKLIELFGNHFTI